MTPQMRTMIESNPELAEELILKVMAWLDAGDEDAQLIAGNNLATVAGRWKRATDDLSIHERRLTNNSRTLQAIMQRRPDPK